jgi:hypothetical protein
MGTRWPGKTSPPESSLFTDILKLLFDDRIIKIIELEFALLIECIFEISCF